MTAALDRDTDARTIIDAPAYVITEQGEVWSRPRTVNSKGGSTRALQPRRLKPDPAGRVTLSMGRDKVRVSVAMLHRRYFPELNYEKPQFHCRAGHPLVGGNVGIWGAGNRVCLTCWPAWTPPAKPLLRIPHRRPGRPAVMDIEPPTDDEVAALVAMGHGYTIETFADHTGESPFPRVTLVPEHLRELEALMRQPPVPRARNIPKT